MIWKIQRADWTEQIFGFLEHINKLDETHFPTQWGKILFSSLIFGR